MTYWYKFIFLGIQNRNTKFIIFVKPLDNNDDNAHYPLSFVSS